MSKWASVLAGFLTAALFVSGAVADMAQVPGPTPKVTGPTPDVTADAACRMKPDRGPCKALFRVYYFDAGTHSCKEFFWGGCQGAVPFQTLQACRKACLPAPPK